MSTVFTILSGIWSVVRLALIPVGAVLVLVWLAEGVQLIRYHRAGYRRKGKGRRQGRRPGLLRSLLWLYPARRVLDWLQRDPDTFRPQGCIIFTGRQGNGKTISMIEQAMRWQAQYPKAKVITNLGYEYEDDQLRHWSQLTDYTNGIFGVIAVMDELQTWFSSNASRDFPPEMLQVVCQNRKNRRVIMGTSQSFSRLAKPIREQATEVRKCWTLAGCLTIVQRLEPVLTSTGDVDRWLHRGLYWYVHTQKLRDSYDTYKVIEALSKSGFQPRPAPGLELIEPPSACQRGGRRRSAGV